MMRLPRDELFTIAGTNFSKSDVILSRDLPLKLIKEKDNEFDGDAIAVYADDKKIGYVANNNSTKHHLTSSASELQDKLQNTSRGCYLFYLCRYDYRQFHIGRIIKK